MSHPLAGQDHVVAALPHVNPLSQQSGTFSATLEIFLTRGI